MKATETLHNVGQSLWLDNITRDLLTSGTLKRYIDTLSITGLTSNPTIFDHAISKSTAYDHDIRAMTRSGVGREDLFFRLAIADLQQAADLFRPIHNRTAGVDGWVSLEVSPLLAYDTQQTVEAASFLHAAAARPNLFIKIPGTKEGVPAIEEATFRGVPINVTLLFSREQYIAAAEAYMRGLERRIASGLSADVRSVASLFVSRWDKATMDKLPDNLRDRLGIAIAESTYAAYRDLLDSERCQRLGNWGAPRSAFSSRAPARKTRVLPTRSISALWRRPTPSIRFRRKRWRISPIMAKSVASCLATARTRERRYRRSSKRASISMRWLRTSNPRALGRSTSFGASS